MKKLFLLLSVLCMFAVGCENAEPEPPYLNIEGGEEQILEFGSNDTTRKTIQFSSNYDWIATPSDSWIHVTPEKGDSSSLTTLKISVAGNTTYNERRGNITIVSNGITSKISIKQEQNNAIILSTPTVNLPQAGGAFTVKVKANINYEYEIKADWIKSVETRALTEHSLRFEAEANPSHDKREGEIIIKGDGFSETVTATQAQTNILTLSTTQQNFACSGGEFSVKVQYNVDYKVEISDSWVTQIESRAIETSTLRFAVAENTTDERRTATITISGGNITEVITVSQDRLSLKNNELYYTSSDGKIIEPYQTMGFSANIVSNTYSNGRGVIVFDKDITAISEYAFYNCTKLTSIKMPKSITKIREYAFYESGLTNIEIPSNVTEIATYAFYSTDIVNLIIPDSVTSIGGYAFSGCTLLTSVTIGNRVNSIGGSAFSGCTSLANITIPNSVTSIGDYAFYGCSSLTSITIPDSVTTIGENTFYGCSSLTSVTIPDSVTSIGNRAFYDCTSLTSVTIPDSVTSIGVSAFESCTSLISVTIPDSVTSIGSFAFYNCTGDLTVNCNIPSASSSCKYGAFYHSKFTKVTIGDSVTSIGVSAFESCTSLTSVTIPDSVTSIGGYAFSGCTLLTSIDISDLSAWCKISFGSSSANPLCNGAKLYLNGSELTNVTIPSDITEIKQYAFSGCTSLTSVTIPDSVTSIGGDAFEDCTSLTSVTIGNSVTSIGVSAFDNCTSLISVIIGNGVTSIEGGAFSGCTSLTSVYCRPTTPPAVHYSYAYSTSLYCFPTNSRLIIYVPRESYDLYTKYTSYSNGTYQTNWSKYKSYVQPYDFE